MRNYPRVYTSFMPNAPLLSGVPGAWIDVMKKCLTGPGWTPFDISNIVVLNGIATLNFNVASASLPDYCNLTISGCDEPLLNGEHRIFKGGDTTGKFETVVADGTYGGTVKAVPTPAGWDLLFTGTNQMVIRSGNPDSSRTVIQVTDTTATTASFNFATDATSVTGLIDPVTAEHNYSLAILKSRDAVAANYTGWAIICDNTTVYFTTDRLTYTAGRRHDRTLLQGGSLQYFGDFISNDESESYAFGFVLPNIPVGSTSNNIANQDGSPCWSGDWTDQPAYKRSFFRHPTSRWNRWGWANHCSAADICNPTWRISGSVSNLSVPYIKNIEKSYKAVPVYGRITSGRTTISRMGTLPGIHYSDIFIRLMYSTFTASIDTNGDSWLYLPVDNTQRDNNTYNTSWGYSPFKMNKIWGT